MKRLLTLLVTVVCAASAFGGDGRIHRPGKSIPGQYIVVLNQDAPGRSEIANELSQRFGATTRFIFAGFHGFSIEATESAARAISHDPRVAWVEANAVAEPLQTANTTTRPFPPGWAIDRTDQAAAPLDGYGGPGCSTAVGIRIYIMDSGITDFDGTEYGTRLRNLYRARSAWPFTDTLGHGTSVASLAGGRRHGLARGAEVVNVKVLTGAGGVDDQASTDRVIDAISRIDVDHYNLNLNNAAPKPAVVNMSLLYRPEDGFTDAMRSAIELAVVNSVRGCASTSMVTHTDFDGVTTTRQQCNTFKSAPAPYGLTYVVGAGNNNTNNITGVPARLGNDAIGTITVGATMMADEWMTDWRAVWDAANNSASNFGPEVDIWAPGFQVDAAGRTVVTVKADGTSMASPFTAGQVARLASVYLTYTSQQLETQLKSGATAKIPNTTTDIIRDVPGGLLMHYSPGKCRSVG
jgi:serine protease